MEDRLLGLQEVCDLLHISPSQYYVLRESGRLPVAPVNQEHTRKVLFRASDVQRYIKGTATR